MLTFITVGINAQLTINVTTNDNRSHINDKRVASLEGTKVIYEPKLTVTSLDKIIEVNCSITKDGNSYDIDDNFKLNNDSTAINPLSLTYYKGGIYELTITVKYKEKNNTENKQLFEKAKLVYIYGEPKIDFYEDNKWEVFEKTNVTLKPKNRQGGANWFFNWEKDRKTIAETEEHTIESPTQSESGKYTLKWKNSVGSGDDEKIWAQGTIDFDVTVFPTPSVSYSPSVDTYKGIKNERIDLEVITSGGKEKGWTYEWDKTKESQENNYKATLTEVQKNIHVTIKNTCKNDSITFTHDFKFIGYDEPSVDIDKASIETHPENAKKASISYKGGITDGWSVVWTDENGKQLSKENTVSTKDLTAGEHTLTATVKNALTDPFKTTKTVNVNIIKADTERFPSDGKIVSYKGKDYLFGVTPKGGKSWSYKWYVFDRATNSTTESLDYTTSSLNAKNLQEGNYTYQIISTDALQDDNLNIGRTFDIEIYSQPKVSRKSSENKPVYDGEKAKCELHIEGGYPGGWTYVWYKNGTKTPADQSGSEYTTSLNGKSSAKTDTIYCIATNKYGKEIWCQEKIYFYVTVNPSICILPQDNKTEYYYYSKEEEVILPVYTRIDQENTEKATWKYTWSRIDPKTGNSTIISTDESQMKLPYTVADKTSSEKIQEVIYRIEAVCSLDGNEYKSHVDFTVNLLDKPSYKVEKTELTSMGGLTEKLQVKVSGGNKWKYLWTEVGVKEQQEGNSEYFVKLKNNNKEKNTIKIELRLYEYRTEEDSINDTKHYALKEPIVYTITVYPKAKVKDVTFDNYYGQNRNIDATDYVSGGYPSGWKYEWYENNSYFRSDDYYYNSYLSYNYNSDKYVKNYQVVATNKYYDGTVWAKDTINVTINAWSRGTASRPENYLSNWDNGNTADLKINHTGGYENGWHYTWYLDDKKIGEDKDGVSWTVKMNDPENDMGESHEVTVNYYNELNGIKGCEGNTTYYLTYWPAPILADKLIIQDNGNVINNKDFIRVGNQIHMTANPQYGYKGGWEYEWKRNKSIISTDKNYSGTATLSSSKDTKYYEDVTYTATMVNYKANGSQWLRKYYEETFRIYNKPQTPTSLVKMGNGTTCTMVVTMPINDEDLRKKEYYLLFGYDDANGVEHYIDIPKEQTGGTGTQRWYNLTSNVFNDSKNKFWVCSVWDYSADNVQITSGKRYVSSKDEDWDGSSTDLFGKVTRGTMGEETTDINSIATDSGITVVGIYTLGGNKIPTPMKGVNILKMSDGSTRKVVVK